MCSSSYLFTKHCLLLLCTIILSTCGGEIDGSDGDSTTIASTILTTMINDEYNYGKEELTTIKQISDGEAQLPVDLLSDDVLLDPNVVLARLSRRDLDAMEKRREYFDEDNDWFKSRGIITRRQGYNSDRKYEGESQRNVQKRMKIYPVFPGK